MSDQPANSTPAENSQTARAKREQYRHQAFVLMFQTAIILAMPAFIGLWLGRRLDASRDSGHTYTIICLISAFILSWTIIIIQYIKFNRQIKQIDREIKQQQCHSKLA